MWWELLSWAAYRMRRMGITYNTQTMTLTDDDRLGHTQAMTDNDTHRR